MIEKIMLILQFGLRLLNFWLAFKLLFSGKIKNRYFGAIGYLGYAGYVFYYSPSYIDGYLNILPSIIFIMLLTVTPPYKHKTGWFLLCIAIIFYIEETIASVIRWIVFRYAPNMEEFVQDIWLSLLLFVVILVLGEIYRYKAVIFENKKWKKVAKNALIVLTIVIALQLSVTMVGLEYISSTVSEK